MTMGRVFDKWLSRRHPMQKTRVTLDRRRIYILPTGAGWAYAGALLVMLLWSINYNNSLAFAMTFLLTAIAFVTMWQTHNALLGVSVATLPTQPVFAGESAAFRYQLQHDGQATRYGVILQWRGQATNFVDIPVGGVDISIAAAALARGWLEAGPLRVSTRFPLGLFQAWSWVRIEHRCLVYPAPAGDLPLPMAATANQGDGGVALERSGNDDYAGLRNYISGDPPRQIAWRASARSDYQQLQVKQFSVDGDDKIWLDWDAIPFSDTEARLAQLCRWILAAAEQQLAYGLRLPDQALSPATTSDHRRAALRSLALFDSDDPTDHHPAQDSQ